MPKEGAETRSVGEGLTTGTVKNVQREETGRVRREREYRRELAKEGGRLRLHLAAITRTVTGEVVGAPAVE